MELGVTIKENGVHVNPNRSRMYSGSDIVTDVRNGLFAGETVNAQNLANFEAKSEKMNNIVHDITCKNNKDVGNGLFMGVSKNCLDDNTVSFDKSANFNEKFEKNIVHDNSYMNSRVVTDISEETNAEIVSDKDTMDIPRSENSNIGLETVKIKVVPVPCKNSEVISDIDEIASSEEVINAITELSNEGKNVISDIVLGKVVPSVIKDAIPDIILENGVNVEPDKALNGNQVDDTDSVVPTMIDVSAITDVEVKIENAVPDISPGVVTNITEVVTKDITKVVEDVSDNVISVVSTGDKSAAENLVTMYTNKSVTVIDKSIDNNFAVITTARDVVSEAGVVIPNPEPPDKVLDTTVYSDVVSKAEPPDQTKYDVDSDWCSASDDVSMENKVVTAIITNVEVGVDPTTASVISNVAEMHFDVSIADDTSIENMNVVSVRTKYVVVAETYLEPKPPDLEKCGVSAVQDVIPAHEYEYDVRKSCNYVRLYYIMCHIGENHVVLAQERNHKVVVAKEKNYVIMERNHSKNHVVVTLEKSGVSIVRQERNYGLPVICVYPMENVEITSNMENTCRAFEFWRVRQKVTHIVLKYKICIDLCGVFKQIEILLGFYEKVLEIMILRGSA